MSKTDGHKMKISQEIHSNIFSYIKLLLLMLQIIQWIDYVEHQSQKNIFQL